MKTANGRSFTARLRSDTSEFSPGIRKIKEDLKGLKDALTENKQAQAEANKEIKEAEKQIKQTEKEIKKSGKTTEEQKKKLDELKASVESSKKRLEELQKGENNLRIQIADANKKINNQKEALATLSQSAKDAKGQIADIGKQIAALGAAISAATAGAFAYTSQAAKWADDLDTLSDKTGISTNQLQKFMYASELVDVTAETMTGSLTRLTQAMAKAQKSPDGSVGKIFSELDVDAVDRATGKLRDRQEVFYELIDALGKVGNETERDAMAMELFGRSAEEINPLIKGGAETIRRLGDEAERAGLILDKETISRLHTFNDRTDLLKSKLSQIQKITASQMIPFAEGLLEVADRLIEDLDKMAKTGELEKHARELGKVIGETAEALRKLIKWIVDNKELVGGFVAAFVTLKTALSIASLLHTVKVGMDAMKLATDGAAVAAALLNSTINASPLGIFISLLAAATAGLIAFGSEFENVSDLIYALDIDSDNISKKIDISNKINTAEFFKKMLEKAKEDQQKAIEALETYKDIPWKFNKAKEDLFAAMAKETEFKEKLKELEGDASDTSNALVSIIGDIGKVAASAGKVAVKSAKEYQEALEKLSKEASEATSSMSDLSGAYKTVSQGQKLDLATLISLSEKYPEYAEALLQARDSAEEQAKVISKLFDVKKQEYIISLQTARDKIKASDDETKAIIENAQKQIEAYTSVIRVMVALGVVSKDVAAAGFNVIANKMSDFEKTHAENLQKIAQYTAQINAIANGADISGFTGSGSSGSGGSSSDSNQYRTHGSGVEAFGKTQAESYIKWIDRMKQLGKMSVQSEIENYEAVVKKFQLTSDEKYDIDLRLYQARQKLAQEHEKKISDRVKLAEEAYKKLIEDRISLYQQQADAAKDAADKEIAALDALQKKRNEDEDDAKRKAELDKVNLRLKYEYEHLEEIERSELERRRQDLLNEQASVNFSRNIETRKAAIRSASDAASQKSSQAIEGLNSLMRRLELFMAQQTGSVSNQQIVNNNTRNQNVSIINQGLSSAQLRREMMDLLID